MSRNGGGPWDFFVSHVQRESGRTVALIASDLKDAGKKVWLDVNMSDCSLPAMMEGVEDSHNFVLVLTEGYFQSKWCSDELRRAMQVGRNVILCHDEYVNVGAALKAKPPEFESIGDETSIKLVVSDRENHRHQWFSYDAADGAVFDYVGERAVKQLQRPCNLRVGPDGQHAVVPALEGPVGILNGTNDLVSLIDVGGLLGAQGHKHPHDAVMLPNGDLIVATWAPGKLSYWRRLGHKNRSH